MTHRRTGRTFSARCSSTSDESNYTDTEEGPCENSDSSPEERQQVEEPFVNPEPESEPELASSFL